MFNIGGCDNLMAEKWGILILMGLRWNWDLHIRHLIVESDYLELVDLLNDHEQLENLHYCSVLHGIQEYHLQHRCWDLQIAWDVGLLSFTEAPDVVTDLVEEDRRALTT